MLTVKGVSVPETERGAQLVGLPKIDVPPDQRRGMRRSDLPSVGPRDAELHTAHDEQQRRRRHRLVPDTSVGVSRDEQNDPGTGSTGLRRGGPSAPVPRRRADCRTPSQPPTAEPHHRLEARRTAPPRQGCPVLCTGRARSGHQERRVPARARTQASNGPVPWRPRLVGAARCRTGTEPAPPSPQPTSRPGPISGPGSGQPRILGRCPAAAAPWS